MTLRIDRNANTPTRTRRNWQRARGGLRAESVIFNEVPSGTINGVNVTFTLTHAPIVHKISVFKNGLMLRPTTDYTVSGKTITFAVAPAGGSNLLVNYLVS